MQQRLVRTASLVAAIALALGACGASDDDPLPPAGDDASEEATEELVAPTPIEVTGSAAAGGEVIGTAESGAATDAAVLPISRDVEYVVADGLPDLPADDTGYLFDGSDAPTTEEIVAVAAAFGLDGEVVPEGDGPDATWRVGVGDGSAGTLWVYGDALAGWNYDGPWADRAVEECAVAAVPASDPAAEGPIEPEIVDPGCADPEPPAGVPSAEEAEALAGDVLERLGVATDGMEFETFADEWFASVNAFDRDGPLGRARTWSFGFGADGVLQYASGALAEPTAVGPYPLVDLDTALDRLADGGSWFGPAVGGPSVAEAAPADPAAAGAEEGELPPPDDEAVPETLTVTLVDVEADLWWVWDADGAAWLLPAYRFTDGDGGWHTVPAVTDDFLVEAETDEPVIDEPVVDEPEVDEPVVAPGRIAELVGLPLDRFEREAAELGFVVRVVEIDGEALAVTEEFLEHRINVAVATVDDVQTVVRATTDGGDVIAETSIEPAGPAPTSSEPPVGIVAVDEDVEFYPACGNETLDHDGIIWYQLPFGEEPDVVARVIDPDGDGIADDLLGTHEPTGLVLRVAEPGPGDDVGTLIVWVDGVARWESDSGDLATWLVQTEITYDFEC